MKLHVPEARTHDSELPSNNAYKGLLRQFTSLHQFLFILVEFAQYLVAIDITFRLFQTVAVN